MESTAQFFKAFEETIDYPSYNLSTTGLFFILLWKKLLDACKEEMVIKGISSDKGLTDAFFTQFDQIARDGFRRVNEANS